MPLRHGSRRVHNIIRSFLNAVCDHYGIDMDMPVKDLPEDQLEKILYWDRTEKKFISVMKMILEKCREDHIPFEGVITKYRTAL